MKFRRMMSGDLDRIVEIAAGSFTDPWNRKNFEETMEQPDARILVGETSEAGVFGYCCIYQTLDEGEIVSVAVAPESRKQGYGAGMVGELIARSREEGVKRFFLEVRESNEGGMALYRRLGFEICGMRKGFYDHPKEDAVVMLLETD